MISSVSSGASAMSMMSSTQRTPQGKNAFTMSDTDADGVISQTELETLAAGIAEVTGTTINVDDALATFDMDSDGGLSGEELMEMLASNGFTGPEMEGQGPPPPPPPSSEEVISAYEEADTDADGVVSQTELEALAAEIEEVTGTTINVDDALATFDMDSDGGLNGEELMEMLASNGLTGAEMEGQGPPPPPPPSSTEAMSAYEENSGDDLMAQLLDVLGNDTETSLATSISITT